MVHGIGVGWVLLYCGSGLLLFVRFERRSRLLGPPLYRAGNQLFGLSAVGALLIVLVFGIVAAAIFTVHVLANDLGLITGLLPPATAWLYLIAYASVKGVDICPGGVRDKLTQVPASDLIEWSIERRVLRLRFRGSLPHSGARQRSFPLGGGEVAAARRALRQCFPQLELASEAYSGAASAPSSV